MATIQASLTLPASGTDYRGRTGHRRAGLVLALIGLALATVTLIANLVASQRFGEGEAVVGTLAWSFGLTTTGLAFLKFGIAVILIGVLVRIWLRAESMGLTLPLLRAHADSKAELGAFESPFGPAQATARAPAELLIHKLARTLWGPMLVMGVLAVTAGLVVSFVWAAEETVKAAAWTQGLQFLGEGFILSGISFLLGTILGRIRGNGGKIQESLGLTVKTLDKPPSAKAFVGLMMAGLVIAVAQLFGYIWAASLDSATQVAANFAWLGPFRELGLGLLLAGIVLALATIATALGFQTWRVREIITTGK